ncbi:MAG TPA: DUF3038 domain-containing protein [Coleofasciculaceae cyanobacterium]|jgi:hypothetical protein
MLPNMKADYVSSQWQELADLKATNNSQLDKIKYHLDLVLLALEAIADISSEAILQAAKDLNLESIIGDRGAWAAPNRITDLETSEPKHTCSADKKLDLEVARSLALIICYLANQHQELLRRGVGLLEQATQQNKVPEQTALLSNYLERFINYYQARISNSQKISPQTLSPLAWKLLIALLFYSGQNGPSLLGIAIFDAAGISK